MLKTYPDAETWIEAFHACRDSRERTATLVQRLIVILAVLAFAEFAVAEPPNDHAPAVKPRSYGDPGGYPQGMGFRRASWESLDDILYQDQVVIGTAMRYREQEKIALEFKNESRSSCAGAVFLGCVSSRPALSNRQGDKLPLCQRPGLLCVSQVQWILSDRASALGAG